MSRGTQCRAVPNAVIPACMKGKRTGQYSIRIDDQWRICFLWNEGQCDEVEIVDYH